MNKITLTEQQKQDMVTRWKDYLHQDTQAATTLADFLEEEINRPEYAQAVRGETGKGIGMTDRELGLALYKKLYGSEPIHLGDVWIDLGAYVLSLPAFDKQKHREEVVEEVAGKAKAWVYDKVSTDEDVPDGKTVLNTPMPSRDIYNYLIALAKKPVVEKKWCSHILWANQQVPDKCWQMQLDNGRIFNVPVNWTVCPVECCLTPVRPKEETK